MSDCQCEPATFRWFAFDTGMTQLTVRRAEMLVLFVVVSHVLKVCCADWRDVPTVILLNKIPVPGDVAHNKVIPGAIFIVHCMDVVIMEQLTPNSFMPLSRLTVSSLMDANLSRVTTAPHPLTSRYIPVHDVFLIST